MTKAEKWLFYGFLAVMGAILIWLLSWAIPLIYYGHNIQFYKG